MKNEEKEQTRKQALEHRDRLNVDPDASSMIADRFFDVAGNLNDKIVALYYPINSEIDTYPLIQKLLDQKVSICLPHTGKGHEPLIFLSWDGVKPLVKSGFGTVSPENIEDNRVVPDVIIVPLVAFDRYNMRLGYGQGHYDRTLFGLREKGVAPLTIGYAYDQQICLFPLPCEDHDQRLDMVLTPSQTY